jgi:osmotically-inducible protein OsmY
MVALEPVTELKEANMQRIVQFVGTLAAMLVLATLLGCASAGEKTGMVVDDSVITAKVKADILADSKLKVFDIKVDTRNGIVQLSGFVDNNSEADHAVVVARRVAGVKSVANDMRLK